jgi:hypothetical protein
MSGIQFVTDEKGRKVAVQIDLKKYGAVLEDFWDGLISESRRKEKGIPLEKIKADLVKRGNSNLSAIRRGLPDAGNLRAIKMNGASAPGTGECCTSSTTRRNSSV